MPTALREILRLDLISTYFRYVYFLYQIVDELERDVAAQLADRAG